MQHSPRHATSLNDAGDLEVSAGFTLVDTVAGLRVLSASLPAGVMLVVWRHRMFADRQPRLGGPVFSGGSGVWAATFSSLLETGRFAAMHG